MKFLASLLALLPSFITCPGREPNLKEMRRQIESGEAILLDVRSDQEWVNGHVAFALHVPIAKLQQGELPVGLPKDKITYVHCLTGRRSALAAQILKEDEYTCVINVKYNIDDFKQAGYPIR